MKKNLAIILLALVMTACSNSTPSRTVFVNTEKFCKIIIEEEKSHITFKSIDEKNLAVDISLMEGKKVNRVILYDGENLIRTATRDGRLLLKGEQLALFKNMLKKKKTIDIKGRIDTYNYFSQKLTAEDMEVIDRIFGEDQI